MRAVMNNISGMPLRTDFTEQMLSALVKWLWFMVINRYSSVYECLCVCISVSMLHSLLWGSGTLDLLGTATPWTWAAPSWAPECCWWWRTPVELHQETTSVLCGTGKPPLHEGKRASFSVSSHQDAVDHKDCLLLIPGQRCAEHDLTLSTSHFHRINIYITYVTSYDPKCAHC